MVLIVTLQIDLNSSYHCSKSKASEKPKAVKHDSKYFSITLSGDMEKSPSPGFHTPKSDMRKSTVRCYQQRLICNQCFTASHGKFQTWPI